MKTYDYINHVVLTLPLTVYEGTWTHSPLLLLCITMILRVRRNFFEITTFPNSGIRARFYALMLYARVEHKRVVGDTSHTAYQHVILWFDGIVG